MKNFTRLALGAFLLLLVSSVTLVAQETRTTKITIVQKTKKEDGSFHISKKQIEEAEFAKHLETLKNASDSQVEIHVAKEGENVRITKKEDGTLQYARNADVKTYGLTKISEGNEPEKNWNQSFQKNTFYTNSDASRPILGIYTDDHHDGAGVKIGSLSTSKGVAAAGLKAGDVITAIDGKTLNENTSVRNALENHKPGDKVSVQYLRDGQAAQAEVTLAGEKTSRSYTQHDPCAVFIGVGTSMNGNDGLMVDYIVENTPAEVSDVRAGDVILSLDNVAVRSQHELEVERDRHQPGDAFALNILRDGKPLIINAKFKECSAEELQQAKEKQERRFSETRSWTGFRSEVQRDPCKVFIGVYTSESSDRGMRVSGVIENTPAKINGVQRGDVILALDDVEVNSHEDLLRERNKHNPGDRFTLSVERQGQYLEVDAQFQTCDQLTEAPKEELTEIVETITTPETSSAAIQPIVAPDRQLKVEAWSAYPNPTFGAVNVQFRAEAVPTQVQIFDALGRKVYEETLNNFDGVYNKQLNISNEKPGVFLLTVRQGEKIYNNKLVLLAKA